jgi:rhodanese-related sulfurtransferase
MAAPADPDWAQLTFSFGGLWEIQPHDLEERLASTAANAVQVIDVREPSEFSDQLGHIRGARLVPLSQLTSRLPEIDRSRPVVTVCRSGARSAQASVLLGKSGFERVANLAGGMLRWRAQSLPVEDGSR